MISDTGRFKRATPQAFRAAGEILEAGGFDYEEAIEALFVPASISQRIAVLKAASRAEILRQGDWLFASTSVNSFEGSAAMALVDFGADVAFVAGRHGDRVRISARCSREAARRGLNLAEILERWAKHTAAMGAATGGCRPGGSGRRLCYSGCMPKKSDGKPALKNRGTEPSALSARRAAFFRASMPGSGSPER